MQTTAQTNQITFTIDGKTLSVPKGTTVYTAAKQLGIEIPIFCYQDRMPPFGACRMCLVEVEKMGKLQTSCTLEATEGMAVKTQSQLAVEGREGIIEFLLINHPLDCPICDRGGECPLQDQTYKYGPGSSRFYEDKRRFVKPLALGPVLMLDRERCIACARCTRFGEIVAGDHALEFIDRGYRTEVGTPDGGPVESKFIGNTIMLCPVGALTSQVYRFRARPWDNTPTQSSCTLCPVGCNLVLDARDGEIMRTRSCENKDLNDIWLCDKGWFGYEFISNPNRLQKPLVRKNGHLEPTEWGEALDLIASKMLAAKPQGKLAALGGNPLTVEENYLFQKLMRQGVGVHNIDHRVGMPILNLDEEGLAPGMEISIGECPELSFAILLGVDLTEEFPVIWLRLKEAINRGAKVIFLGHYAPEIAQQIAKTVLHAPGQELEILQAHLPEIAALAQTGKKGALFVGQQYLANAQRQHILSALDDFRSAWPQVSLNLLEGRGNSFGARFAGMRPDLGPLGTRISKPGLNALQVLDTSSKSGWDFLYVAGANPALKYPGKLWKEARAKLGFLVVQDIFLTETAQQADVVLPSLCFVEKEGTFLNIEGRPQKLQPGKDLPAEIYSDGTIFMLLAQRLKVGLETDEEFRQHVALQSTPSSVKRLRAKPKTGEASGAELENRGELKASFAPSLFDHGVRMQHNPHLNALAKAPRVRIHPQEGAKRGLQSGDTVRIKAPENSISAKIKFDDSVAMGTVVLPLGFPIIAVHELGANLLNGMVIELSLG